VPKRVARALIFENRMLLLVISRLTRLSGVSLLNSSPREFCDVSHGGSSFYL